MGLFESPEVTPVDFSLWLSMKNEFYNRKMDARDELLARITDAAARIKKREDQLRQKTRDLRTRAAMCTEVDGGIFENLLYTATNCHFCVTNFSFEQ
jgi:hypothetical protein